MALIKRESIERAVDAADMIAVVSARTPLRRVGARWTGRCPFHEERTPSFSVNPDRKLFHCFGCGKGGDLIGFVRETEGLDFAEAVEWLADRAGVQLEYEESSPRADASRRKRDRLFQVLEAAAGFYSRYLWESAAAEPARTYLVRRGFREDVCKQFRLGVSPDAQTLPAKARERGFTQDELVAAGLVNRRSNDYFAGRLVFALRDPRGRVVGFGARRMSDSDPIRAKYVNSPEGELFHKTSLVYGLDQARTAIAKEDRAVVVEGYTDVLALHQAGMRTAVASMGTALTPAQLKELRRLTGRLYLCFDADAAGEAATLRGMDLAVTEGFDVRVVPLPAGVDPADTASTFGEYLADARSYAVHRVRVELDRGGDPSVVYERVKIFLDGIPDSPDRHDAWRIANDALDMTVQIRAAASSTRAAAQEVSRRVLEAGERLERDALAGVVAFPDLAPILGEISPDHFDDELHRALRAHLISGHEGTPETTALLAELDARAAAEGIDEETARQLLLRLRERQLRRELAHADPKRIEELREQLVKVRAAAGEPV
jgi:DNA primase